MSGLGKRLDKIERRVMPEPYVPLKIIWQIVDLDRQVIGQIAWESGRCEENGTVERAGELI